MMELAELLRYGAIPSFMLAAYFAYFKVGHKVGETHSFRFNRTQAFGISEVILTNLKDRSTPIFALYAIKGEVLVQLIKFDNPIVLKSFDSIKVEIPPVSEYYLDGELYEFSSATMGDVVHTQIYYSTISKFKKCMPLYAPTGLPTSFWRRHALKIATPMTNSFNGRVYSSNVIYIIEYKTRDGADFAFVDASGFIHWSMAPNGIDQSMLSDPQLIADRLLADLPFIEALRISKTYGWGRRFGQQGPFNPRVDATPIVGRRGS